jgi:hypothetical protein
MRSRTDRRTRSRLKAAAASLACLVLAFAIVTGLLQANTRYFYCEAMGMMREDPCAAASAAHRDEQVEAPNPTDELSRTPFTCCSTGVLGALPSSTSPADVRVEPAQLVAFLALPSPLDSWELASASALEPTRAYRFRVAPRPARELRAQSMVFLT